MSTRVLHVIEGMGQGGAETLVVEHVRHAAPDVEPLVCALNRGGPALEMAAAAGARTFALDKGGSRRDGLRRLAEIMRAEGVTVANGHNPTGGLYAALAGRRARLPAVIRTEHSVHYAGRHSRLYPWVMEPLATLLSRRVVCVCEAVRESHVRRLPWAAGRFVTVRNGVSPPPPGRPRDPARAELGAAPGDRVVLNVGSLTPQKGQAVLIDAFAAAAARLPAARLWIAGDGPLRRELEDRARASGLGARIRLLGARADVSDLIEAADVFALSSFREGLSVTLLEAMRAGRATIATRVGGNGEAVADGETGLIVPPGDAAALAAAIVAVLSDPPRAAALGAAGRARWAREFTAERMVRETETVYRALLRPAAPSADRKREDERHASA